MAKKKVNKKKKISSIIGGIILYLFIGCMLFVGVVFIVHISMSTNETNMLYEKGYYNHVSAGDYHLNVVTFGNQDGKHLVGISGFDEGDFALSLNKATTELQNDHSVSIVDRAGYGFSDDTDKEMTIENIVEAYRKALSNANIKTPYVLVGNNEASIYMTYWDSLYPEEIEGVIYLNGTILDSKKELDIDTNRKSIFLAKAGYSRFYINSLYVYPEYYTDTEVKIGKALALKTIQSSSINDEGSRIKDSYTKACNVLKDTDSKKLYISFNQDLEEVEAFMNKLGDYEIHTVLNDFFSSEEADYELWEQLYSFIGDLN